MTVVFAGERGVAMYQALVVKSALGLYARTGLKANRAYTPKAMMATAKRITGVSRGARDYYGAIEDLERWIEENRP
jgi:hypothetical protein